MLALLLACSKSDPEPPDLEPVVGCDDPAASVTYTEVGAEMGLLESPDPDGPHGEGGSLVVLDVDGDDDLDLVIAYPEPPLRLYRRSGDVFELETIDLDDKPWLLSTGDVDADGHLDLLVGAVNPMFLRGNGSGFDAPEALDTLGTSFSATSKFLAPGDFDGDGHLDLFAVVNAGGLEFEGDDLQDHVLWGDGTGSFTVDRDAVPSSGARRGFDASLFEWQGQPAVYVSNDMGTDFGGNVLYELDGRVFVDASDDCGCGVAHSAMGHDVGDWNRDGLMDVYVAATPWNALLTAQPDGSLVDVATSIGAGGIAKQDEFGMAWGAAFVDFDNDGHMDILDAQGDFWFPEDPNLPLLPQPIWLLRQEDGAFTDVSLELGLNQEGSHRSVNTDDHNGDGIPDLLVTDVVDRPLLYLSDGCTANAWLDVEAPVDSRVEVTADGTTWTAWTQTRSGYASGREPRVHFGLGDVSQVDQVVVTPPTGDVLALDGPFEPRRRVEVR